MSKLFKSKKIYIKTKKPNKKSQQKQQLSLNYFEEINFIHWKNAKI